MANCEQHVTMFTYAESNKNGSRLVSLQIVTENYEYLSEYIELGMGGERMRFLVDSNDTPQIFLSEQFKQVYRRLYGLGVENKLRKRRQVVEWLDEKGEPVGRGSADTNSTRNRQRRVIVSYLAQAVYQKENVVDYVSSIDLELYKNLTEHIYFSYYTQANQTIMVVDFDVHFSRAILSLLVDDGKLSCLPMRFVKSNFIQRVHGVLRSQEHHTHRPVQVLLDGHEANQNTGAHHRPGQLRQRDAHI